MSPFWMLLYLVLVLGVIFLERKNPQEALLWVLVLLCIPYVGALLYLIFGSTIMLKISDLVRRRRMAGLNRRSAMDEFSFPAEDQPGLSESDAQVIRFNYNYNGSPLTRCRNAEFLTSGAAHYERLFADIASAKESIHMEFYTIHNDRIGNALVQALAKKAAAGVEVWVMCDYMANISSTAKMFLPLTSAGGIVRKLKPWLTHFRSHRKIVSIDGRIGYIGGMNIGQQYANFHEKKKPWRDTQVRLTGSCTAILENWFLADWVCAVQSRKLPAMYDALHQAGERPQMGGESWCQFVAGGAENDKEAVKMCYLSMIRSAKHTIRIQSPYFVPDESILDALKTAAASGVHIALMIPGIEASFFLDPVTRYYSGQLLEYGAEVLRYRGYVHAKTMTIDDELCCIGSVNMDIRSLRIDDEICGVFYDNKLVEQYINLFNEDCTHCDPYLFEEYASRSVGKRAAESFFLLFAPLM